MSVLVIVCPDQLKLSSKQTGVTRGASRLSLKSSSELLAQKDSKLQSGSRSGIDCPAFNRPRIKLLTVGRAAEQAARFHKFQGAVAQLGERLICIQEVAGSIPTSSTNSLQHPKSGPVAQLVRAHR